MTIPSPHRIARRLRTLARLLHRAEGGQISFLTVFGAVALAGLFGLVMTTGDQTTLKVRTQNAADAAALSGGAWIARGLNVTSAANVAQTQLVGGAILLDAFVDTMEDAEKVLKVQIGVYTACSFFPPTAVFCRAALWIVKSQKALVTAALPGLRSLKRRLADCPGGWFWRAARALEGANRVVHDTFFAVAAFEAARVGRAGGARTAVLLPGPVFHGALSWDSVTLPTERRSFPALCQPMTEGSPTPDRRGYGKLLGYPVGQGPFLLGRCRLTWVSAALSGVPPAGLLLMPMHANAEKAELCGTDTAQGPRLRPAEDIAECRRFGGHAEWRVDTSRTGPVGARNGCDWFQRRQGGSSRSGATSAGEPTTVERACGTPPPGRRIREGLYCSSRPLERTEDGRTRHEVEVWTRQGLWIEGRSSDGGNARACSGGKPRPYLLRREPDVLRYLVVARRPNRRILFSSSFLEEPPAIVTYAQVEVYNGLSADAFTQDWRVRLERATLLERPFQAFDDSRFAAGLNRLLDRAGADPVELAGIVSRINNH